MNEILEKKCAIKFEESKKIIPKKWKVKWNDECLAIQNWWKEFSQDESGMGVVEVILIIVVLISLVIIFKKQITDVVKNIMKSIEKDSKKVYGS